MSRIISVIALLLACALTTTPSAAQNDATQGEKPVVTPQPPPPGDDAGAAQEAAAAAPSGESNAPQLQEAPPARYTVKRGDTLWGISSRFLKNPWKWPDVWGMNRDQVKNPHLIYPGDVIILDLSGATPRLRLEGVPDGGLSRWYGFELQTTKLEPRMRARALASAIPTIAAKEIEPFLVRPLVVEPDAIARAPTIVATPDARVVLGANDTAYAIGIDRNKGNFWNVYRPGRIFLDPDTKEVLGHEAVYLGDAEVLIPGEVSALRLLRTKEEVGTGDRLAVIAALQSLPYIPRGPERPIRGKIVAGTDTAVSEIGPLSVVIINRGARDGLESGNVLGLFRSEGTVPIGDRIVPLPEERYGLVLVFRVFNRMSYALVMGAQRPVHILDTVKNP